MVANGYSGPPKVYFRRMAVFVAGLVFFFAGAMAVFYQSHKKMLASESAVHLNRISDLISDQLSGLEQELQQRLNIIHSNVLLQEYMFVVSELEGDPISFLRLYKQQIGYIPGERNLVLTLDGTPIVGGEHKGTMETLNLVFPSKLPEQPQATYVYDGGNLELMARVGIFYKDRPMGQIVVVHPLDEMFLRILKLRSGGDLFLVASGQILQSTLEKDPSGQSSGMEKFRLDGDFLTINNTPYRVRQVPIKVSHSNNIPELWLGVNQQTMIDFLNKFLLTSLVITLIGATVTLVFGMHLIQTIIRPIESLVKLTQNVADGKFPKVRDVRVRDEMDYLTSGFYSMVSGLQKQRQKIEEVNKELKRQSLTDPLTGLYNRRYFDTILPKLYNLFIREGRPLYIMMLDIDHFKKINDTYGHDCGDAVLIRFSHTLQEYTRKSDFRFRVGGEEFVLLFTVENREKAFTMADKFRMRVADETSYYRGVAVKYTVSIGMVEAIDGVSPKELLKMADKALYSAKESGRNKVCIETT